MIRDKYCFITKKYKTFKYWRNVLIQKSLISTYYQNISVYKTFCEIHTKLKLKQVKKVYIIPVKKIIYPWKPLTYTNIVNLQMIYSFKDFPTNSRFAFLPEEQLFQVFWLNHSNTLYQIRPDPFKKSTVYYVIQTTIENLFSMFSYGSRDQ